MKKVYEVVKESQQAGINSVTSGITCSQVDAICRDVIKEYSYDRYFIHSTGHGIGLEVHEPPWLWSGNSEVLKTNMAITIEPGIYLNGKFGVRIEDSVIINANNNGRVRDLNTFTKDLIILD